MILGRRQRKTRQNIRKIASLFKRMWVESRDMKLLEVVGRSFYTKTRS